jgi:hypothetical protein
MRKQSIGGDSEKKTITRNVDTSFPYNNNNIDKKLLANEQNGEEKKKNNHFT